MAVSQISKICIKKGSINYLPDSLDEAEMCFTTDTGQVFIGAPNYSAVQYRSSQTGGTDILPYRNIRLLTEFDLVKSLTGDVYVNGPLINVTVPTSTTPVSLYTFETGINSIVASISLYDGVNVNMVSDLYISIYGGSAIVCTSGMKIAGISFGANISNNSIVLNCTNTTNSSYTLYMNAKCWKSSETLWDGEKGTGQLPICTSSNLLSKLDDVQIGNLTNNQVLQYNSTDGKWENSTLQYSDISGTIVITTSNLSDFKITNPKNNQVLQYNSTDGKWENSTLQYSDISGTPTIPIVSIATATDVKLTNLTNNQVLQYNSTDGKWENSTLQYSDISGTPPEQEISIAKCTDVDISNLQDQQFLQYNSTDNKWENITLDASVLSNTGTQVEVACASTGNVNWSTLPKNFDGYYPEDGDLIFLWSQNAQSQNGIVVYNASTNTVSRPTDGTYDNGQTITSPFYVSVDNGTKYGGQIFQLESPITAVVDTTATNWELSNGAGVTEPSAAIMGPAIPYLRPAPASARHLAAPDIPVYQNTIDIGSYSQFPYLNMNNFGYVSRYIQPASAWNHTRSIEQAILENNVIIFDRPVYLGSAITSNISPLSKKHFVFTGGRGYHSHFVFMTNNTDFMYLDNTTDIVFEGILDIRTNSPTYSTNAIAATGSVKKFKAEYIYTTGFSNAVYMSGAVSGLDIGTIEVDDITKSRPLYLSSTSTSSGSFNIVGNIANLQQISTGITNANSTWRANYNSPIINYNTSAASSRTVTLSIENATHGFKARFLYSVSGSPININGLRSLTGNDWCEVIFDGSTATWNLIGYGNL